MMLASFRFSIKSLLILFSILTTNAVADDGQFSAANTAWILSSSALVLLMTLPGLALFYGGLVRTFNIDAMLLYCRPSVSFMVRARLFTRIRHR